MSYSYSNIIIQYVPYRTVVCSSIPAYRTYSTVCTRQWMHMPFTNNKCLLKLLAFNQEREEKGRIPKSIYFDVFIREFVFSLNLQYRCRVSSNSTFFTIKNSIALACMQCWRQPLLLAAKPRPREKMPG